ncbi:MAG: zinc-binding alcohol dehydrogenase family protein [Mucilaginibacter sp.]
MKTLVCTTPGHFEYQEADKPILQKGYSIIKIRRVGICGTDLHAFEGTQPYFEYPRILGHELAGELIDFDNAPGFAKGDRVTIIPYFNCGSCVACRNGKPNCCVNIKVFGVHIDGGMAEYISVPSSSLVKGEDLSYDELALIEPLAIGAHGVRRAGVQKGEFVLVIGAGPIGLGAIELARTTGAKVIAMDVNAGRLLHCQHHMRIEHTVNAATENSVERIKQITGRDMPTVVIDATGSQKAINNGFQYMAHGGRYVLIGLQKGDITFSHPEFHKREAALMSSRNATREDFEYVIHCLNNGHINPKNYITHKVGFDEVANKFESWLKPEIGVIKAMVTMD